MSYPDAMVDIETLGNRPSSDFVILSVGIVAFDLEQQDTLDSIRLNEGRTAEWRLDIAKQRERHIDADTVLWWLRQDDAARQSITEGSTVTMGDFFAEFEAFIHSHKISRLWGNGPSFDNAALRHLFDSHAREFPLKFWCDRDLRTVQDVYERATGAKGRPKVEKDVGGVVDQPVAHSAMDDAIVQVLQAQFMERRIRGG